jgi:type II secretory pathway component PulK
MTLTELTLVKGITPAMLDGVVDEKTNTRLRDCLTIYSNQASYVINVNSAPKPVLMALDTTISESVADRIINMRPFINGTGDFPKVTELNSLLTKSGGWSGRLKAEKSSLFRVVAVAKVKESARTVEAVISNGAFLSWQEY